MVIDTFNLYSNIVNSNWNIELPKENKEVYSIGSEESFLGDGKRYHILKYDNDSINLCLDWNTKKDLKIESSVNGILSTLKVPEKNIISFDNEYKYYYKKEDDSSELFIVFIPKFDRVYIVEDIY